MRCNYLLFPLIHTFCTLIDARITTSKQNTLKTCAYLWDILFDKMTSPKVMYILVSNAEVFSLKFIGKLSFVCLRYHDNHRPTRFADLVLTKPFFFYVAPVCLAWLFHNIQHILMNYEYRLCFALRWCSLVPVIYIPISVASLVYVYWNNLEEYG